jgi:hypothetical protein
VARLGCFLPIFEVKIPWLSLMRQALTGAARNATFAADFPRGVSLCLDLLGQFVRMNFPIATAHMAVLANSMPFRHMEIAAPLSGFRSMKVITATQNSTA